MLSLKIMRFLLSCAFLGYHISDLGYSWWSPFHVWILRTPSVCSCQILVNSYPLAEALSVDGNDCVSLS